MSSNKLLAEFLGTFFLVTVVAMTGNPLAIGAILMVMVYAGGPVSGAHYNPAVTFAMFLKKQISARDGMLYVLVQAVGGLLAAALFFFLKGSYFSPQPAAETSWLVALLIEILFTFLLVNTIIHVTDAKTKGNSYFGLAIGAALFIGATVGGPISGGAFNPVVGIAPWVFHVSELSSHLPLILLYLVGPLAGASLAAVKLPEFSV